ncbi:19414_t:CDS:1, partial [Racocetra persica]
ELSTKSEDNLYYNFWEDEFSLAIYLAKSIEGLNQNDQEIYYNIKLKVTTKQRQEACKLLVKNYDIFTTDIFEEG